MLASFLAITIVPAAALAWLSWRIVEQDRALESQRVRERLERSADHVVATLDRRLAETENQLGGIDVQRGAIATFPASELTDDALIVRFSGDDVEAHPSGRLLYYPVSGQTARAPPAGIFQLGEGFEFRQGDFSQAIAAFRDLARATDPLVRAGALARLARNLRKNGQPDEALDAYDQLARLGPVPVAGVPAELLARRARCVTLAERGRASQLRQEASELHADLERSRWRLDRASYVFHEEEARRWASLEPDSTSDRGHALALAEGVDWLWHEWQFMRRETRTSPGHRSLWVGNQPVLVLWQATEGSLTALVAGPRHVAARWGDIWSEQHVEVVLSDAEGHEFLGRPVAAETQYALRAVADTRLPWTLRVSSAIPGADFAQLAARRRLLLAGLALMALLTILGAYFTARATARELAVARLQSDFVSAVSHEFRTPLTSLRHLTELLAQGTVASDDRRRQYYSIMARETERLHRLVEGLLDFGRMAAGQREYRFEPVDAVELAESVVEDFRAELAPGTRRIALAVNGVDPHGSLIHADREALSRAIRNLLDNAVKYSPEPLPIGIELGREGERIAVHVRDQGVGIPPSEQKRVFEKFVRGTSSLILHVKGTGIGLAMVQHIVHAHGGEIRLQSEPGRGSTFTLLLPVANTEATHADRESRMDGGGADGTHPGG